MKKSLIIALLILFSVIGWFVSGQISVGNENIEEKPNIQKTNANNDDNNNKNSLKVESQIFYAEKI